jgi:hypothetical protein
MFEQLALLIWLASSIHGEVAKTESVCRTIGPFACNRVDIGHGDNMTPKYRVVACALQRTAGPVQQAVWIGLIAVHRLTLEFTSDESGKSVKACANAMF